MDFTLKIEKPVAQAWADRIQKLSEDEFAHLESVWESLPQDVAMVEGSEMAHDLPAEYRQLRELLIEKGKDKLASGDEYGCDVECGLAAYGYLNGKGFNEVLAETDDLWRYITLAVIPDLTYVRYPKDEKEEGKSRIRSKRFFGHTRRIWIKTLWWFIHLSWQGTEDATRQILAGLGSDAISQLIERSGSAGYRVDIAREVMKHYGTTKFNGLAKSKLFQKVMARHLIYFDTLEPAFTEGGIPGYVSRLFTAVANGGAL